MELGCEEERAPILKVQDYIQSGNPKGAINFLNGFIKKILEENRDNWPKKYSIRNFPRPSDLLFHHCDGNRKRKIRAAVKKELEKELTDFALKQEGGTDSILKRLDKEIDGKFSWDLVDLAETYGNYHHWLNNFVNTKRFETRAREECIRATLRAIGRIGGLREFSFNDSRFAQEIVDKYKKISPRVELSTQLLGVEEVKLTPELSEVPQENIKIYEITIENISLVPILNPRLEFAIESRGYKDGQFREDTEKMTLDEKSTKIELEYYKDKLKPHKPLNCLVPGYLYTFVFACHKLGPASLRAKGKLFYEEPFLKGVEEKPLEEIKSDNWQG